MPVVATGLAGGQAGLRIVERLTGEAILNDFVRIEDESRTTTAVVDPTNNQLHRDQRVGPGRCSPRSSSSSTASSATCRRARASSSSPGSLPRDVGDDFYAEAIRELRAAAHSLGARLRRRAAAVRRRGRAVPRLAEPGRGRGARRPGVPRRRGLPARPRRDRRARRAQRDHHDRGRLLTRSCARTATCSATALVAPRVEPVSRVGAGDVLLAAFVAAWAAGRGHEECLREAVAAGAASTLELGAGRFDPREAHRLQAARDGRPSSPKSLLLRSATRHVIGIVSRWRSGESSAWSRVGHSTGPRSSRKEGLTFDDVLLVPAESAVLPNAVSTATRLTRTIALNDPGRLGRDGHGDRGAHGDRARARGRDRDRPPEPARSPTRSPRSTRSSAPRRE